MPGVRKSTFVDVRVRSPFVSSLASTFVPETVLQTLTADLNL